MAYNVHGGHNSIVTGASKYLDEVTEDRLVKNKVISLLKSLGHTVYDCTDDSGTTQSKNLANIVTKCNKHTVTLDISIHLNAGGGTGCEVYYYTGNTTTQAIATTISAKIASSLGIKDRGAKASSSLYVLRKTSSPSVLIECCFVDSTTDEAAWDADLCAAAIVEAITGTKVSSSSSSSSTTSSAGLSNSRASDGKWYYYDEDGNVATDVTTIAQNNNGWFYVKNGVVDFTFTGLASNDNGWWYVENGQVNFDYTGFAANANGAWWYVENSKVTFSTTSVIKGTVKEETAWWNVVNSQVIFTETVAQNSNGWWYINDGKVDFTYTGFASNDNGWWYLENGKVGFDVTDVIKGTVNDETGWWKVTNSKVDLTYTGLAKNSNGWWYLENGKVNFDFNGIAQNSNGTWYIENGKVQFDYDGEADVTITVSGGKVQV